MQELIIRILLVWLMIVACLTEGTVVTKEFKKLEPGKNLTGIRGTEITTRSILQCSDRCLGDDNCDAYQYQVTGAGNCIFIKKNCTDLQREILKNNDKKRIYEITPSDPDPTTWNPPSCWTGPNAAFHQSFDASDGFVLMEGMNEATLKNFTVPGKVNFAWNLDQTRSQWLDLGNHTEVCMTRPETCGAAGGAISLWVNVIDCGGGSCGIVSSYRSGTSGSIIYAHTYQTTLSFRIKIPLTHGDFFVMFPRPSGWFHVVVNYLGPDDGEGIRVYKDGAEVGNETSIHSKTYTPGDGRLVVGRYYTDQDLHYAGAQVDELILFNQALSPEEIQILSWAI